MNIYIVTAYRWGSRDDHSYPIGAFNDLNTAIAAADSHTIYRGGKYYCEVDTVVENHYKDEDDDHSTTVYKTKK